MGVNKGSKGIPIRYFVAVTLVIMGAGMKVSRVGAQLEPEIDCIATDLEDLAGFCLGHTVKLYRLDNPASKIVAVGFGHLEKPHGL